MSCDRLDVGTLMYVPPSKASMLEFPMVHVSMPAFTLAKVGVPQDTTYHTFAEPGGDWVMVLSLVGARCTSRAQPQKLFADFKQPTYYQSSAREERLS